jgi:hypothetical protein
MSLDETAESTEKTVKEQKMEQFTVIRPDEKTAEAYEVESIPLNFVIDKEGVVRLRDETGEFNEKEMSKLVEDLVKQLPQSK